MKLRKVFKISGLFIILMSFALPCLVQADIYIKQKKHTDAYQVMGQTMPAKDEITITWMTKDKARIDQGEDKSMIIRLDKNIMYSLDHTKMTYGEMPLGDISKIISEAISEEVSEEEKEKTKEMAEFMKGFTSAMMQMKATVTDTGEKKKIKGWNCRKYILKMKMPMGASTSEIWATENIKINYELYRKISYAMTSKQPGFQEALKEMKKIKGIAVLTISSTDAMGSMVKTTEELLEIKEKSAPRGIYDIPKGYVKVKDKLDY